MNNDVRLDDFDHLDPEFSANLVERLGVFREKCPVAHSSHYGGYTMLTRYSDLRSALGRPNEYVSSQRVTIPDFGSPVLAIPVESDPPLHKMYRDVAWDWFTPGAIRAFEPEIRAIVADVLESLDGAAECDAIRDIASLIPPRVIARRCGIANEMVPLFCDLIEQTFVAASTNDVEASASGFEKFFKYLTELLESVAGGPVVDVVSAISNAYIDGRPIESSEASGLLHTIVTGGHETTINSIGFMLKHLASRPDIKKSLLEDSAASLAMIEESLRLDAPFQFFSRTLTQSDTIDGEELPAGEKVLLAFGAANRDADEFVQPDDFRLDRRPNRHMSFGYGIHKCMGQHLARAELLITLEEVLARFPNIEVASEPPSPVLHAVTWGLPSMRVRLG